MSTETTKPIRLGGVLYAADTPQRNALRDFAKKLQDRGWHVAGLVQELAYDDKGEKIGLDAIDIQTGKHLPLARPSKEDRESGTCGFDIKLLADTSSVLLKAMNEKADLLIVEKFGEREQDGNGLAEEIVTAAMNGIPTLVAVPVTALETWNEFTGRLGTLIPHDMQSLQSWWPKWNLYRDLAFGVAETAVKQVVIGEKSILVETANGCGVTSNPTGQAQDDYITSHNLKELALNIQNRKDELGRAIAVAAILAHYNRFDLTGPDDSGLFHFQGTNNSVLVVGSFPTTKDYSNNSKIVPVSNALQDLIEHAYDGVILPSHTFSDGLLPTLLDTKAGAETVIVGPETPLSNRLLDYGISVLSGRIINDPGKAAEIVRSGGGPKDLKPASTYITLQK